jgi:hypothetical protein
MLLSDKEKNELENYHKFYPLTSQNKIFNNLPGAGYALRGFPLSKFQKHGNGKYVVKSFDYSTNAIYNHDIPNLNSGDYYFIFTEYDKEKIKLFKGDIIEGPNPVGISGSGLWFSSALRKVQPLEAKIDVKLVGINTSWFPEMKLFQSTKMEPIVESIEKNFCL